MALFECGGCHCGHHHIRATNGESQFVRHDNSSRHGIPDPPFWVREQRVVKSGFKGRYRAAVAGVSNGSV
jgi:hypothetical protein